MSTLSMTHGGTLRLLPKQPQFSAPDAISDTRMASNTRKHPTSGSHAQLGRRNARAASASSIEMASL